MAAEFGSVAIRARREINALDRMGGWLVGISGCVGVHLQFMPGTGARLQNVKWQGVEQLVGKMNSIEGRQILRALDPLDIASGQCGSLFFAENGSWFYDGERNPGQRSFGECFQDIA